MPAYGLRDYLSRMFHAVKDTKSPFYVSCAVVVLNVALNLILREWMGANGLALATSISSYIGVAIMFVQLRKRFGRFGTRRTMRELGKILLSAAVCALVCAGMNAWLPEEMCIRDSPCVVHKKREFSLLCRRKFVKPVAKRGQARDFGY